MGFILLGTLARAQFAHVRRTDTTGTSLGKAQGVQADSLPVSKYVIQGWVVDDQGAPVEGAALHIGKQVAYTDSSGHFMLRFSKRGTFTLSLAPEEFITNGVYQVVSAPSEVNAQSEDSATDVQVVVRRVPPPQAKLYRQ